MTRPPYSRRDFRALLDAVSRTYARSRLRRRAVRGVQYGDIPADMLERIPAWISQSSVPEGVAIRPGRVYRFGNFLLKFYGRDDPIKGRLRASGAVRSAAWHARLLPLRTPRPLLAIEVRSLGRVSVALLVTEFIDGHSLLELWRRHARSDRDAFAAFPAFMAEMHRRRVYHGDFHPLNLLWDGREWVLIDLDGMRRRQNIGRRIIERQWVRIFVVLDSDERLRPYFERYLDEAGLRWDRTVAWERIRRQAAEALERRSRHVAVRSRST